MRNPRLIVVACIAFVVVLVAISDVSAAFKFLSEGMEAPEVKGRDLLTGDKVTSKVKSADGESIIIVAFWATWSDRSIELLSDLAEYVRDFDDPRLKVVAVNVEGQRVSAETLDYIRERVSTMDLPFPVILDKGLEIFSQYGVVAVPSAAVLNEESVLRYGPAGYSYLIRDRIIDSMETYLGLKTESEFEEIASYIPTNEASRFYNLAREMVERRLYGRALIHLDHALEVDPEFPALPLLRGDIHLLLSDPDSARMSFERATMLAEESPQAWAGLGRARLKKDELDEAEQALRKAIELDEAYSPAIMDLALCRFAAGDLEEASTLLSQARQLLGTDPAVDFRLGEVEALRGNTAKALAYYGSALDLLFPLSWDPKGR